MRRVPPAHLGILRRRSCNPRQPQGQDRDHTDERSLPQTLRFFQPIGRGNSKMKPQNLVVLSILVLELLSFQHLVTAQAPAKHKQAQKPAKQKSAPEPIWDLVVAGGTVVTMDPSHRILENGIVVVKQGDTIFAVEASTPAAVNKYMHEAKQLIDARGKLVLPGFINGHNHAPMTLLPGLKDDVTLEEWLTKFIFPAEAKNVNEEFVRWGTRLGLAEQLRVGVTTFADMYYFEDAVAEETKAAGVRCVLGETILDFPAPDNKNNDAMLEYTEKFLKRWQGDALIHAAAAPHSMYTCSEKTLQDTAALARRYNAPILIHVGETRKELNDSREKHGTTPVQYLDKLWFLLPVDLDAPFI